MITRFECRTLFRLIVILVLHARIKRQVRRLVKGWQGGAVVIHWPDRTLLSVSLWDDFESIYGMGNVPRHVRAARLPQNLGVRTASGIYSYSGDWRRLMFGTSSEDIDPLLPVVRAGEAVMQHSARR